MDKNRVLLVDDDINLLKLLSLRLKSVDFLVETATSGRQALGMLSAFQPNLVITDLKMNDMDGMSLFENMQKDFASIPVIMLTAHGTIPGAVEATRKGVFCYLTKPFDSQQLLSEVRSALHQSHNHAGYQESDNNNAWRQDIITQSPLMEQLLNQAFRVAQSDVSILIQGASGTGKEVFAQAIHKASHRNNGVFVPLNCAAIPDNLLESELFGHRKGAFTGASKHHTGLIESANKGTLFLDEIGDMPLDLQAKLLRILQEREVRPVGATQSISVDIRLISATHRDLDAAVDDHKFREDLYYRLNVVVLEIPSLAQRREDIPVLAKYFLKNTGRNNKHCLATSFSPEAIDQMIAAPWPGNIRQLMNVVEQVAVLCNTQIVPDSLIVKALRGKTGGVPTLASASSEFEREYLVQILQTTEGNVTKAAKLAQRNRTEFYKLLKRHKLEAASFRQS